MIRRLQRKFICIVMLSLGLVILLLLGSINLLKSPQREQTPMKCCVISPIIMAGFQIPKGPPARRTMTAKPAGMNEDTGFKTRFFVVWLDEHGNAVRVNTGRIAAVSSEEAVSYGQCVARGGTSRGYQGHYRYRVLTQDSGSMVIFLDCSTERSSDRFFLLLSCAIGAVAFAAVSCIAALFSRRAIRPIEEAMEKQQQFLEDASHELKTPLAIISANNDVLELTVGTSQWSDSIRNQVSRMDGLLQSMLALTKLDAQRPELHMELLDFSSLISQAAESFDVLANANQVSLSLQVAPGAFVTGDADSLRQLVSILMENAIKYARTGRQGSGAPGQAGEVTLLLGRNTCTELPTGNLNRLFDRFYRADTSRSRETGGYGIGLSIAKSICLAHHAKISAEAVEPKSIRFTVSFS